MKIIAIYHVMHIDCKIQLTSFWIVPLLSLPGAIFGTTSIFDLWSRSSGVGVESPRSFSAPPSLGRSQVASPHHHVIFYRDVYLYILRNIMLYQYFDIDSLNLI